MFCTLIYKTNYWTFGEYENNIDDDDSDDADDVADHDEENDYENGADIFYVYCFDMTMMEITMLLALIMSRGLSA